MRGSLGAMVRLLHCNLEAIGSRLEGVMVRLLHCNLDVMCSRLERASLQKAERDTTGLNTENRELKLRLQAMEQQAHLRDAINDALREELQRLKLATGQIPSVNGNVVSRGLLQPVPQYFAQPQQLHNPEAHQPQQPRMSQPSPNGQHLGGHDNMEFM